MLIQPIEVYAFAVYIKQEIFGESSFLNFSHFCFCQIYPTLIEIKRETFWVKKGRNYSK